MHIKIYMQKYLHSYKIYIVIFIIIFMYLMILYKCRNNFKITYVKPLNRTPPIMHFGRSKSESIAINAFSLYLHEHGYNWKDIIVGYRPDFLINESTGKNLEIDAYHPIAKIGIEYNGIQHYVFPNTFHPDTAEGYRKFKEGLSRDELKRIKCIEHGICLISIPYHIDTCRESKCGTKQIQCKHTDEERFKKIYDYINSYTKSEIV